MRPRELTVRGFRSYSDETRFSFDGRGLVGIVGPIGSGKSSILDAVSFALYGKTPRVERDTKSLINQRHDSLAVSLTFDVDDETYKAVRSLRRGGSSAHALYRLAAEEEVVICDRAREMGEAVEALLGLDFDAFRRSVLLAQNQFAGFLEATPAERDKVLKGVFGFEVLDLMRGETQRRLGEVRRRLERLEDRRASAAADQRDLDAKRAALVTADERATALEALRAPFVSIKDRIADATRETTDARQRLERIDAMAARIPDNDASTNVIAAAGSGADRVTAAERGLEEASRQREEAAARLDEVLQPVGGHDGMATIAGRVASWKAATQEFGRLAATAATAAERLETERSRLADLTATEQEVVADAERWAAAEREAAVERERARTVVLALNQEHRAHALRSELVVGAPCPVCAQTVTAVPEADVPADVVGAEAELTEAEAAAERAGVSSRTAAGRRDRVGVEIEEVRRAVDEFERAVAEAGSVRDAAARELEALEASVRGVLGAGEPDVLLGTLREGIADAQAAADAASAAESEARTAVTAAREAGAVATTDLASLRADLATLAGHLGMDIEIGDAPGDIEAALGKLRSEWIEQRAAADAALVDRAAETDTARAALTDLLTASGLGVGDDVVDVIAAAVAERSAKEAEVALLEHRLADLSELAQDESDLDASAALLSTIDEDLTAARFLRFLLDDRRRALADLASEHFGVLTGGRYRFDESGEFQVIDLTAAESVRAPASLSGGETFLASLALALALAEVVSREGGRLDAFFLDEGFGSLDPEHLDLAMDGVERLVTSVVGRLVVVVSHVPAMAERIEDLIVLDRDPVTGNTVVTSGSGPS